MVYIWSRLEHARINDRESSDVAKDDIEFIQKQFVIQISSKFHDE